MVLFGLGLVCPESRSGVAVSHQTPILFLQKNKTNFKPCLKFNSRAPPHTYLVKPSKFSYNYFTNLSHSAMKLLGKSEYDFYRWKNGLFPKTLNLLDIAKTFDVSLDFLVGDKLI